MKLFVLCVAVVGAVIASATADAADAADGVDDASDAPSFYRPSSTRKMKTDIHYLSSDELTRLADDARGFRLATWRYKGRLDDGRSHVGYILEDAPLSMSTDMKREEVDLYAYTSMTLALAQEQQREIADLKREVRELRQRVDGPKSVATPSTHRSSAPTPRFNKGEVF